MSKVKQTEVKTPPCPMCASDTVLKEMLRYGEAIHYFFKCVSCALVYPVSEDGGRKWK
jgi:uncharacterized Zn finger protein